MNSSSSSPPSPSSPKDVYCLQTRHEHPNFLHPCDEYRLVCDIDKTCPDEICWDLDGVTMDFDQAMNWLVGDDGEDKYNRRVEVQFISDVLFSKESVCIFAELNTKVSISEMEDGSKYDGIYVSLCQRFNLQMEEKRDQGILRGVEERKRKREEEKMEIEKRLKEGPSTPTCETVSTNV